MVEDGRTILARDGWLMMDEEFSTRGTETFNIAVVHFSDCLPNHFSRLLLEKIVGNTSN
jgi:hypothetical protein